MPQFTFHAIEKRIEIVGMIIVTVIIILVTGVVNRLRSRLIKSENIMSFIALVDLDTLRVEVTKQGALVRQLKKDNAEGVR